MLLERKRIFQKILSMCSAETQRRAKQYQNLSKVLDVIAQFPVSSPSKITSIRDFTKEGRHVTKANEVVKFIEGYAAQQHSVHVPIMKFFRQGSEDLPEVHISSFMMECLVFSSLAKPKRLIYRGSDGVLYKVIAKSGDDLRKDMYAQELCKSIVDAGAKINIYNE